MTPKEKIKAWFFNPKTPAEAWKEWTLEEIAEETKSSVSSVLKYLPDMVRERIPEIENYVVFRQERKTFARQNYKKGQALPDEDAARIRELRREHTIHEVSAITGFSPSTVHRYSS